MALSFRGSGGEILAWSISDVVVRSKSALPWQGIPCRRQHWYLTTSFPVAEKRVRSGSLVGQRVQLPMPRGLADELGQEQRLHARGQGFRRDRQVAEERRGRIAARFLRHPPPPSLPTEFAARRLDGPSLL